MRGVITSQAEIPGLAFIWQLGSCCDSMDFRMDCLRVSVRHPGHELKEQAISEVCAPAVSMISGTLGILKVIQMRPSVWHSLLV